MKYLNFKTSDKRYDIERIQNACFQNSTIISQVYQMRYHVFHLVN